MDPLARRALIDRALSERELVTLDELQALLHVSVPTIKRDLCFMREVLQAPLVYSRARGGYRYEREIGVREPQDRVRRSRLTEHEHAWYSAKELYCLVKTLDMMELLKKDEASLIKNDVLPILARVRDALGHGHLPPKELLKRIHVVSRDQVLEESDLFEIVGLALAQRHRIKVRYAARGSTELKVSELSPQRLVHYKNRWYLDAYCHDIHAWRTYAIENIKLAEVLPTPAKGYAPSRVSRALDQSYGLFRSGALKRAVLVFDEVASPHIRRERWHPRQRLSGTKNQARLSVPYTNATELMGEILRWGTHVKVLAPEELKKEVQAHLRETLNQYLEG